LDQYFVNGFLDRFVKRFWTYAYQIQYRFEKVEEMTYQIQYRFEKVEEMI